MSTPDYTNPQMAQIFERQNLLPINVMKSLVTRAHTLQEWLGQVAVDDGLLSYEELAVAISREKKIPLINLKISESSPEALELITAETCRDLNVLPINITDKKLLLAMENPLDAEKIDLLAKLTGQVINPAVVPANLLRSAIVERYSKDADSTEATTVTQDLIGKIFADIARVRAPAPVDNPTMEINPHELTVDQLLLEMLESKASDLHLAVGSPPMMRVHGELLPMGNYPMMTPSAVQMMIYAIVNDEQMTTLERKKELDFAYSIPRVSRFRVNVHRQRGSLGAVMRTIPENMPTLDSLGMPRVVYELTMRPRGLVLVTGPTGSGKTTTLAAMIDEINRSRRTHIVSIEDPIEFLHNNKMSVVTQREIGVDTDSFAIALRHVLRQDPDVILIGEMRDLETISAAVTAAETGHLVFATLHTTSAAQTIERIIDVFPSHQQEQIRSQLSNSLEGILTQTLLPNIDGRGRSCAQEILVATPAIRNLIREGKIHQMPSILQASAKYGMQTLDNALKQLVRNRKVSLEAAIEKASNPEDFTALLAMD